MKKEKDNREGRLLDSPIDPEKVNRPDLMAEIRRQAKKSSKKDSSGSEISGREAIRKALRGDKPKERDPGMPIVFRTAAVRR
jgi:hypothetical protein